MSAALPRLLKAVRRRLVATLLVRGATLAAWWLAAVTLALGAVHRWWVALDPTVAVAVGLAPPLVAVLLAVWRRTPTLDACARHIDRVCDGRELVVAGWEIARTPGGAATATARLVARRAEAAAAEWLGRLEELRGPVPRGAAFAAALVAAGAFLLAGPSLAPPRTADAASAAAATAATEAPAAARTPAPERTAGEARARPMTEDSTPGAAEPEEGREPSPLLLPQLRAGVDAGRERETGQLAATARATSRPEGRAEPVAMEVRLIRAEAVDSAAERAAGSDSVALDAAAGASELRTAPTTRNTAGLVTTLNRFAPAERKYLAAYFDRDAERASAAPATEATP